MYDSVADAKLLVKKLAGIPAKTIYDEVEPTLVARNLVEVTPHGRRFVRGA